MPKLDSEHENGLIMGSGNGGCTTPTPIGGFARGLQATNNLISEFDAIVSP
jgi:hypothetical protein